MWDLTITTDHDFYIDAASTAVLAHNCPTVPRNWQDFYNDDPLPSHTKSR
jgi:hypothetical protein